LVKITVAFLLENTIDINVTDFVTSNAKNDRTMFVPTYITKRKAAYIQMFDTVKS